MSCGLFCEKTMYLCIKGGDEDGKGFSSATKASVIFGHQYEIMGVVEEASNCEFSVVLASVVSSEVADAASSLEESCCCCC